jgi:hypothetical protein
MSVRNVTSDVKSHGKPRGKQTHNKEASEIYFIIPSFILFFNYLFKIYFWSLDLIFVHLVLQFSLQDILEVHAFINFDFRSSFLFFR